MKSVGEVIFDKATRQASDSLRRAMDHNRVGLFDLLTMSINSILEMPRFRHAHIEELAEIAEFIAR